MESTTNKKLILIGASGSGKSYLGRAYSERNGSSLFDTDEEFTRRYGDIKAFFESEGEEEFRKIESELQSEAAHSNADVVVCGGGGVCDARSMAELRTVGDIVRLTAPSDVIYDRIKYSDRPLKNDFERLAKEREPLYKRYADYTIDGADGLSGLEKALKTPRGNRYDILLCDADDTVLDFQKAMRTSVSNIKPMLGVDCSDDELISAFRRCTDSVFNRLEKGEIKRCDLGRTRFEMLAKLFCKNFDCEKANDAFFEEMKKTRFVRAGALDFLNELRSREIKIYIATNSFACIAAQRLKALKGYVDGVFVSETVGFDKPQVEFFERVYESLGRPNKDRMLMFGDSNTSDIAGGKAFGIDTCFYDPAGERQTDAEYRVDCYDGVLAFI